MAIQKSNRVTRRSRRSSGRSIIPNTTASMITAASTGLRQVREQRRQHDQREQHQRAGDQRRDRRPGSGRLVQGAGREAGRDRHALEHARRRRWPCPARPTPGRRRSGSGGGWRTRARRRRSARSRSTAAPPRRRRWWRTARGTGRRSGSSGVGSPRGTSPTSSTPCAPRSNRQDGEDPAGHQHQRPRNRRREEPQRRGSRPARRRRRATVVQWTSPSERDPRAELPPRVHPVGRRPGQLRQLADHHVHRRPGQEARDHRLGQEARDPAQPKHGQQQEQRRP